MEEIEPQGGKAVSARLKAHQAALFKVMRYAYEVRVLREFLPTGEEVPEIGIDYLMMMSVAVIEALIPVIRGEVT